jgi:hypothetical protein
MGCSAKQFEHEFLIKLSPIWLACRWRVMGNPLYGRHWPKPNLSFALLGMCDYSAEMRETCAANRQLLARADRQRKD